MPRKAKDEIIEEVPKKATKTKAKKEAPIKTAKTKKASKKTDVTGKLEKASTKKATTTKKEATKSKKTTSTKKEVTKPKKAPTTKKEVVEPKKSTTAKKEATKSKKTTATKKEATKSKKETVKKGSAEKSKTPKKVAKISSSTEETVSKKPAKEKTSSKKTTTKISSTTKKAASKTATKTRTTKATGSKKATTTRTRKTSSKKIAPLEYYDLPNQYEQTLVKILAQTPTILFVYWDISAKDRQNLVTYYGENFFNETTPYLQVKNKTKDYQFEVEINDYANSWYLHIPDSDCEYEVVLMRRNRNSQVIVENNGNMTITSSNQLETPNDHILFEKLGKTVFFQDTKTHQIHEKDITSFGFIHNMGRIYNIYDLYKEIYQNELNGDELGTTLSSSNFSSNFK